MTNPRSPQVKWFASGGDIVRTGPFPSQIAAYKAMTLTNDAKERQRRELGVLSPYSYGTFVWPEFPTKE